LCGEIQLEKRISVLASLTEICILGPLRRACESRRMFFSQFVNRYLCSLAPERQGMKRLVERFLIRRVSLLPGLLTLMLGVTLAVAATAPLTLAQQADRSSAGQAGVVNAAQAMAVRRQNEITEVQAMLSKAEADRSAGRFSDAYVGYATALKSTPKIPATAELRRATFSRYQIGAMDFAKQLADGGQPVDAQTVLTRVLADARDMSLDASLIRDDFRALLAELKDPEIHSPVRTPQHIANVATVSKLLKDAQGAVALADLDTAHDIYIKVLNADPYNEAAARGLEKVNRMAYEYEKTAHDHTKARFLREVEGQWEMPVPPQIAGVGLSPGAGEGLDDAIVGASTITEKLARIVIPSIQFEGAPLRDVLDFLGQRAAQLDTAETDPAKRGVNIIINGGTDGSDPGQRPVTIKLANVPLDEVLRYVTGQAQLTYRVDSFAVSVVPISEANQKALVTRSFVVPPNFIGNDESGGADVVDDPFATPAPESGTTLVKRMSAEDFLRLKGIDFPDGASATYVPSTNRLIVRNTPDAVSFIESMVFEARSQGAKMVDVHFKMISVGQLDLEENGFDWLLSPGNIDSSATTFFSGGTPGNQQPRASSDFPFINPGTGVPIGDALLTSGLRSGDVKTQVSIDDVLDRTTASPGSTVAPGIFGLANVFGDTQFQSVWRGVSQAKGVDRLCESNVMVKPGQTATVKVVREFIFPTEYDPPEVPNDTRGPVRITLIGGVPVEVESNDGFAVTPAHPTAFETRDLGKVLEVQPLVDKDNLSVNLTVSVDLSDFIGFVNYGVPILRTDFTTGGGVNQNVVTPNRILQPVFEAVKETTNVEVWDGQTIMIGGFIGDTVTDVEDKLPVLGDIPGVGRLFRSSVEDRTARAIMLFVSVRIVDPAGMPLNQIADGKITALNP